MNYVYIILDSTYEIQKSASCSDSNCTRFILGENGVKILRERCNSDSEREYVDQIADKLKRIEWAYNMIYLMKQACGHYEIFQTQVKNEHEASFWLDLMAEEAKHRKCTRCTCGW